MVDMSLSTRHDTVAVVVVVVATDVLIVDASFLCVVIIMTINTVMKAMMGYGSKNSGERPLTSGTSGIEIFSFLFSNT